MAMIEFRETIKYDPQNWQARYLIATDYFNKKKFKEAVEEFKKITELNPNFSNSYGLMGEASMQLGSYDLAVEYLNTAVKLDPAFARNYYRLGLIYRKMNNGEKVKEMLAKLKSLNSPLYDDLRLNLYSKNQ
jgi:tetratricopeptide (TPR) repeat protein